MKSFRAELRQEEARDILAAGVSEASRTMSSTLDLRPTRERLIGEL